MSVGNEWFDRLIAGLGGGVIFMAAYGYWNGEPLRATLGLGIAFLCVWACAPVLVPERSASRLGVLLTQEAQQCFIDELSAVYGVTNRDEYPTWIPADSWDPFGTPIIWCHAEEIHAPHLWPVHGPSYAPVLCIGHNCDDPVIHMEMK